MASRYYPVVDNGGNPFVVKVVDNQATVFNVGLEYEPGKIRKNKHVGPSDKAVEVYERISKIDGKQIFHLYNPWIIDAKRIFVAKGEENAYGEDNKRYVKVDEEWEGNTILIETGDREYVYVGSSIFSFQTKSPINLYRSIVGNNAVPYPYAVSEESVYLLDMDNKVLALADVTTGKDDPYYDYYERRCKVEPLQIKLIRERD